MRGFVWRIDGLEAVVVFVSEANTRIRYDEGLDRRKLVTIKRSLTLGADCNLMLSIGSVFTGLHGVHHRLVDRQ